MEKKVTRIDKNREEITENIFIYYNILIARDFWQVHYQILSINFVKELIKLDVNLDTMRKNVELVELIISIVTVFSSIQTSKMI